MTGSLARLFSKRGAGSLYGVRAGVGPLVGLEKWLRCLPTPSVVVCAGSMLLI